jgi:hypothetical protein
MVTHTRDNINKREYLFYIFHDGQLLLLILFLAC